MDRRAFLTGAAALALAPDALARRLGGTPTALVTADLESHVAAVELSTGRVVKRIRTMPGPRSVEALSQTFAVVAHTDEGALTVIDGPTLRVLGEIGGFAEPRYAAASRDGRHVYVTDSARGEVVAVDAFRRRIVARVDVGGAPRHVSLHRGGTLLWTVLGNAAASFAAVDVSDPRRPRLARVVEPPFPAHDVGFAPGGNRAWLTSGDRGALAIFDVRSRRVVAELRGDRAPQHVTFDGRHAFVSSGDDGLLRIHDLDGRLAATRRIPAGSFNVQREWDVVLTPSLSRGTLCIVGRDGRVRRTVRVARSSHDACFVVSA
jgi:hypothetical protein